MWIELVNRKKKIENVSLDLNGGKNVIVRSGGMESINLQIKYKNIVWNIGMRCVR